MPKYPKWTIEKAIETGKKYNAINEWHTKSPGSYRFLLNNHRNLFLMLKESFPSARPFLNRIKKPTKWSTSNVLKTAKNYYSISSFCKENIGAWFAAHRYGICDEVRGIIYKNKADFYANN